MPKWTADNIPNQTGRRVIVTGANSGLGYETALALARKGATVIMACRDRERGDAARNQIRAQVPHADVTVTHLDLSDLASVAEFASAYACHNNQLDLLVNNAGLMGLPQRRETVDGFEMQFGVNHLGHFALTAHLLPVIAATPHSRIVTVSSGYARMGRLHWDDLMWEQSYSPYGAYAQSKLSNLLFAFELNRRLNIVGSDTISVAAHPGYAATNLQGRSARSAFQAQMMAFSNRVFAQSQAMGALPQLYAATAPGVRGGAYFGPQWMMRGHPVEEPAPRAAHHEADAVRLWELSEQLTGASVPMFERVTM